jgi:phage-related protein
LTDRKLNFWDESEWRKTVVGWPPAVRRGFAKRLRVVQLGGQPQSHAKPLSGFDIPIWELWHRDGQRVVYTVHYAAISGRVDILV